MKGTELLKILKKHGCYLHRHDIWYSPITNRQFPVPRHKDDVKTGTAKSILKGAGD